MMTSNAGLGELVRELRATLETISLGLFEGQPDRLLDAEPRLADIAVRLASLPPSDIEPLRPELVAAQAALRRCERLGATVVSLANPAGTTTLRDGRTEIVRELSSSVDIPGYRSGLDTLAYELAQQVNIAAGSVPTKPTRASSPPSTRRSTSCSISGARRSLHARHFRIDLP